MLGGFGLGEILFFAAILAVLVYVARRRKQG